MGRRVREVGAIERTPDAENEASEWSLPEPHVLHSVDPFQDEEWRAKLHLRAAGNKPLQNAEDNG